MNEKMDDKQDNPCQYAIVTKNFEAVFSQKTNEGFTSKYDVGLLVYFETFQYVNDAIKREKQLKKWDRQWKINLIEEENKDWNDLSLNWYD